MATDLSKWDSDQTLYLFTSLTAGSSHIITATSRMETILKANRIPFTYIDTATNEEARKLFQRRAAGKKLPLLVKEGYVLGDITEVEELNEFGELPDVIGHAPTVATSITTAPQNPNFTAPYGNAAPPKEGGSSAASTISASKEKEPSLSAEAQEAMARASSEVASIAASKKSTPSVKVAESEAAAERPSTDRPRSSIDSAAISVKSSIAPMPDTPATATSGDQLAGQPDYKVHRGSSVSEAAEGDIKKVEEATAIPEDKEYQPKDIATETPSAEPSLASASRPSTTFDDETLGKASFESTGAAMADAEKDLLRELERGITHTSIEDQPKAESSTTSGAPAYAKEPTNTKTAEEEPEKGKQKAADNGAQDGESEA
ncbi:uncharacterized protein IWZ02DRAFT_429909 [Phyllosticta citriasiana]|uniref:Glutaredoxin domain-containing protein n=1 Tax=Phyllosticta citriasiana TaxID=595635 RepID=A0ABR1KUY1_9PEZI